MQKFHTSIFINAPVEKVWHTMLDGESYRDWASAFEDGSYYQGSWDEGAKITFIGPDADTGDLRGMVSRVVENRPYECIVLEHTAILENDIEDSASEEAKKWVPANESYTFVDKDGGTEVLVDVDLHEDHKAMFERMWADALQRLKILAEGDRVTG